MERIYHRFELWECYRDGFFSSSNQNKDEMKVRVVELFSSEHETERYMNMVIEKWKYSCEHNLTNISLNRVAWLGQAACCIYAGVSFKITMESWRLVPVEFQNKANLIAEKIIKKYEQYHA